MSISSVEALGLAHESRYSTFTISKASLANAAAGQYFSLFTAAGLPAAGTAPGGVGTGPIVCSSTTTGGIPFMQQTSPLTSYLTETHMSAVNANTTIEIHDRIAHISGLVGNSTAGQITAFDFNAISLFNSSERRGDSNYSDIQWWLEWYTATGATASNATLQAVYNDGTSSNLTTVAVGGTVRAGRMIPLNSLVPAADQGKFIRGINTVTLSASTGTAGNFGITATRYRCSTYAVLANKLYRSIWHNLSLPQIYNDSCLFPIVLTNSTTTGVINGKGRIVHG